MALTFFRTAWGLVGPDLPWPDLAAFARDAAAEGYDGVEFAVPMAAGLPGGLDGQIGALAPVLEDTALTVIPLIATRPAASRDYGDAALHFESFREQLAVAVELGAPRAAVHGGADSFDHSTSVAFFRDCMAAASDAGVHPMFETHRGRPLYTPWATRDLLEALPEMRLTSDLSHWMPVVDRWPDDVGDLFLEASRRSDHLHARVGHEKGPQVPDPRDPVWQPHVELHRDWWSETVRISEAEGRDLGVAPEFGPPPYMNATPYAQEPVADLIEVNEWMAQKIVDWFE